MEIIFSTVVIAVLTLPLYSQAETIGLRILAESLSEQCTHCVDDMRKKAYALLDRAYKPGTPIDNTCGFIRTDECGVNEFVSACTPRRAIFRKPSNGQELTLPLVVYAFYYDDRALIGIKKEDFTLLSIVKKFSDIQRSNIFYITASLIPFSYGHGKSFLFNASENRLTIFCHMKDVHVHLKATSELK